MANGNHPPKPEGTRPVRAKPSTGKKPAAKEPRSSAR